MPLVGSRAERARRGGHPAGKLHPHPARKMPTNHTCRDCSAPFTGRRDAKSCPKCGMLRVLSYCVARRRLGRCKICRQPYRAHTPRRDSGLCGEHAAPLAAKTVDCVLCKRTKGAVDPRVPLCVACVRDPVRLMKAIEALERGQKDRRAQYQPTRGAE